MADSVKGGWVYPSIINNVKRVELGCGLTHGSEYQFLVDTRDVGGDAYLATTGSNLWVSGGCTTNYGGTTITQWLPSTEVADESTILSVEFNTVQPFQFLFSADTTGILANWKAYWTSLKVFDSSDNILVSGVTDGNYGASSVGGGVLYNYTWKGTPPTPSSDTPRFARPLFNRRPAYRR